MTNLSSLSKTTILQIVALAMVCTDAVNDLAHAGVTWKYVLFHTVTLGALGGSVLLQIITIKSLQRFYNVIAHVAKGDFEKRILNIREQGELRTLANAINHLVDLTDAFVREACNSMEAVSQGYYYRKVIERGLPGIFRRSAVAINAVTKSTESRIGKFRVYADDFEQNVSGLVKNFIGAAGELERAAETMSNAAESTSILSDNTAHAAGQASQNVATVASAAEELSASIAEIDRRVSQSASIAAKAAQEAAQTDELVRGLAQAAQKIGDVIQLINDIASQTNLLALNATIEAARAGEAGKGFAVVAGEVKNLASQTAKATDEIAQQINAMQSATDKAVEAIRHIGTTIAEINQISSDITASVDEQRAATQEIAQNVQQASMSTTDVSGNIDGVSKAAIDTKAASSQVVSAAKGLNDQTHVLQSEVDKFLATVRET